MWPVASNLCSIVVNLYDYVFNVKNIVTLTSPREKDLSAQRILHVCIKSCRINLILARF
jgi:hypothetical protein